MKKLAICIAISIILLPAIARISHVRAETFASPIVLSITPDSGPTDEQTDVIITGDGFTVDSTAYLDETALLSVTFIDSTTLQARVPFGLPAGEYGLTVANPEIGSLPNAFTVTAGSGEWANGGPYGGRTRAIAINPTDTDTVYVAADQSGLYRTTDGGAHWSLVIYSGSSHIGMVEVAPADPPVVYFGGEDGLYRSDQGGDAGSWSRVVFNPDNDVYIQPDALAVASSNPDILYCSYDNKVFYSEDGGGTWTDRSQGLPNGNGPLGLAVKADESATVYASFQDGSLYKTTNAGQAWAALSYSIPVTPDGDGGIWVMAADPYRTDALWVGTWQAGLHLSLDGGVTFNEVISLNPIGRDSGFWDIAFDPNQDRIFVGVSGPNDSIYYSDDAGGTWHGLGLNNQGGAGIAVTPGDSDTIYTTWAGVRKSTDGGQTWTWLSEGISAVLPWRIAVSPLDHQRVITVADADGAFGSHNSGNEWVTYSVNTNGNSDQNEAVAFDPVSPNIIYVGGTETVYKTINDGEDWLPTASMPVDGLPLTYERVRPLFLVVHPQIPTTVYAGVSFFNVGSETINAGALYRSDDSGDSWTRVAATGAIEPVNLVVLAPGNPQIMYLGTGGYCHWCEGDGIWRSTDAGATWEHPESELLGLRVMALAVHPENPDILLAGVWDGPNSGQGIYRSADGGDSWQATAGLLDWAERKVPDIAYAPLDSKVVYAATHGGLRVSFDGGLNWQAYPGPMGTLPITALTVTQGEVDPRIYIGTAGGTIAGQTSMLRADQPGSILGAGVYVGYNDWHFISLPLVVR